MDLWCGKYTSLLVSCDSNSIRDNIRWLVGPSATSFKVYCRGSGYKTLVKCHEETKSSEDLKYHLMNDHEVVDVLTSYGQKWIEERMHCIRRGSPFQHLYPPH